MKGAGGGSKTVIRSKRGKKRRNGESRLHTVLNVYINTMQTTFF